jgi:5'-3' exonuclease
MLSKKESDELTKLVNVYKNYPLYCSLLSVLGDKSRSVESITGVGPKTLQKYIDDGIQKKEIQLNTTNPAMISTIFHDSSIEDEFVNNYYCTTISEMYKELTQSEISSVLNQRRDRLDMNSLINLNNSRFANYPLILESLLL